MKIISAFKDYFKNQLGAKSPRRIILVVALVAGGFWLGRAGYNEWQMMRIISVITDELHMRASDKPERVPVNTNNSRA